MSSDQFALSKHNNLIYFIVDTCDGRFVTQALEDDPAMFQEMTGFTYYPNATSTYSRTYPSIIYLLTRNPCYFDKPYYEYANDSFSKSNFWYTLSNSFDDLRIYTSPNYIGVSALENIDNYCVINPNSLSAINIPGLLKAASRIGFFKTCPYLLKDFFAYNGNYVNTLVVSNQGGEGYYFNDLLFWTDLQKNGISTSSAESTMRFYHMWGTHPGCKLNENAEYEENTSPSQTLRGDMKIISFFLAEMKKLGIYDQSTIIITADHGSSGGGDILENPGATCIMLVKPAGSDSSRPCTLSKMPVSQEDLFSVAIAATGEDYSAYGELLYNVMDVNRERYYNYSALYSNEDGEIALREYRIIGDASNKENWILTGRNWNINYSENTVSNLRLETELPNSTICDIPDRQYWIKNG